MLCSRNTTYNGSLICLLMLKRCEVGQKCCFPLRWEQEFMSSLDVPIFSHDANVLRKDRNIEARHKLLFPYLHVSARHKLLFPYLHVLARHKLLFPYFHVSARHKLLFPYLHVSARHKLLFPYLNVSARHKLLFPYLHVLARHKLMFPSQWETTYNVLMHLSYGFKQ